jgi:hypothetical protein
MNTTIPMQHRGPYTRREEPNQAPVKGNKHT